LRRDRFLEKSKRVDGLSTAARLWVRVGGYKKGWDTKAVEHLVGSVNAVAGADKANVDERDVRLLALRDAHGFVRRNRHAHNRVTEYLQYILHIERDEKFIFNDQYAKRSRIQIGIAVLFVWIIATARRVGGEPELSGEWVAVQEDHEVP
jgi:hypothetical protein